MLLTLIAAHRDARPATLAAIAQHLMHSATTPSPALTRALLGNPALPPTAADDVAAALTRAVAGTLPTVLVAQGATFSRALLSGLGSLSTDEWAGFLLPAVPAPDRALVAAALAAPAHNPAATIGSFGPTHPTWRAIASDGTLPADLRARALVEGFRSAGRLTAADAANLEHATRHVPDVLPRYISRGTAPRVATILRAAASPFPAQETPGEISVRLRTTLRSGAIADPALTTTCVLIRSGPHATAVANELLRDPRLSAPSLAGVVNASTVSAPVRTAAARRAVTLPAGPHTSTLLAGIDDLLYDPTTPVELASPLIAANRLDAALTRTDLTADHLDAALLALAQMPRTRDLPERCADLALLPSAGAQQRAAARAAAAPTHHTRPLLDIADAAAADPTRWQDLPVAAAPLITHATPGLAHAFDVALSQVLPTTTAAAALALVALVDGFGGTVLELFDVARTIAA